MSQTAVGSGGLSQPDMSQLDPSQEVYLTVDYQSQIEGLRSQDSNYQAGRSGCQRNDSQF